MVAGEEVGRYVYYLKKGKKVPTTTITPPATSIIFQKVTQVRTMVLPRAFLGGENLQNRVIQQK